MARNEHHVVHNPNGGWDVKSNDSHRVSVHTETKASAMQKGRQISHNQGTELIVHGIDGKIQNSDSHGNDPCPPKDTK